jgi:hypothetical protein
MLPSAPFLKHFQPAFLLSLALAPLLLLLRPQAQ